VGVAAIDRRQRFRLICMSIYTYIYMYLHIYICMNTRPYVYVYTYDDFAVGVAAIDRIGRVQI
jgi:hypothetical protein